MIKTTVDGDTITHVLPDGRINVITDGEQLSAVMYYPKQCPSCGGDCGRPGGACGYDNQILP